MGMVGFMRYSSAAHRAAMPAAAPVESRSDGPSTVPAGQLLNAAADATTGCGTFILGESLRHRWSGATRAASGDCVWCLEGDRAARTPQCRNVAGGRP
jgi:hypothetical protein